MSVETMRTLQAYGFIFFVIFLCFVVYGYWFHLKKSEKTGRRNYEKYGKLALDDELSDDIIESHSSDVNKKEL